MGRKDSDYLLNLQEEIEKSAFFNQMFGYVGEYGYFCTLIFISNYSELTIHIFL